MTASGCRELLNAMATEEIRSSIRVAWISVNEPLVSHRQAGTKITSEELGAPDCID